MKKPELMRLLPGDIVENKIKLTGDKNTVAPGHKFKVVATDGTKCALILAKDMKKKWLKTELFVATHREVKVIKTAGNIEVIDETDRSK